MEPIYNTRDLQLFSVIQAMSVLGYQLMMTDKGGKVFYNPSLTKKGLALMSMQRAFMLHNCIDRLDTYGFDFYTINQFLAAKVVHNVKLQYSKTKKSVYVNGGHTANYVAFVDYSYPELFNLESPVAV
jgi:hypothetical protein